MFFEGIVEKDDVEFGYVKVRIFGKHNRDKTILPTDDLPNAKIVYSGESNIDEISYYRTICNGTWVICGFLDADEQIPIVLGSIVKTVDALPDFTKGFTDENGVYPSKIGTTIPSEARTNYPHNRVLKTKKHLIEIDDTDGAERINIKHDSGTLILINPDGSITIEANDINIASDINITGDIIASGIITGIGGLVAGDPLDPISLADITATNEIIAKTNPTLAPPIELSTHIHAAGVLKDSFLGGCSGETDVPS